MKVDIRTSGSWIWPLPRIDRHIPALVSEATQSALCRVGYPCPLLQTELVPVFAVADGVVSYAGPAREGAAICIEHHGGWTSRYDELELMLAAPTVLRTRRAHVRGGDVIGYASRASATVAFGLQQLREGEWTTVEPSAVMRHWPVQLWAGDPGRGIRGHQESRAIGDRT